MVYPGTGAVTVSVMVVVADRTPEVPVIVIVEAPPTTQLVELPAVSVSTLLPVAGLVPKVAVTPLGSPDAASVTGPAKLPESITLMVSVALAPCASDRVDAEGLSEKLPVDVPQVVPLTANDVGTALVVPFQVPLNPMPEMLPPAGTLPL